MGGIVMVRSIVPPLIPLDTGMVHGSLTLRINFNEMLVLDDLKA